MQDGDLACALLVYDPCGLSSLLAVDLIEMSEVNGGEAIED
jgi:hypothetical protein